MNVFSFDMRCVVLNTGTELLLGDVVNAHLDFIAHEIFSLGLRVEEQRTVPDGEAIRHGLSDLFSHCEILFVTGGLGPTSDDITREIVADSLGLQLRQDGQLLESLRQRLAVRKIKWTPSIARQADVPSGAQVLPNEHGSAPGLYLRANINPRISSPHIFVLPGPPRELQPMFRSSVLSILRTIVPLSNSIDRRIYRIAGIGESLVEQKVGDKILAIPGIELGYCARPGDVDLRIVGDRSSLERADAIIREALGISIYSVRGESLEEILVKLLADKKETLAVAESCTGGLLAHRMTNVPGASDVFNAGYVTYANAAKIDILEVDPRLIDQHGAVSEPVGCAMAEGARARARSTYALATTGIAGPSGGSPGKPVGTVYIALASDSEAIARKFFFPTDRETFKDLVAQTAFDLLRRKLCST
ncbi:MAG: CinA family nicotinamide mononucleotide deamidase-related protein, partial [Chthoniobacterales bacterium]